MFCTKCGAKLDDGAKFCASCGAPAETPLGESSAAGQPAAQTDPGQPEQTASPESAPGTEQSGYSAPPGQPAALAQAGANGGSHIGRWIALGAVVLAAVVAAILIGRKATSVSGPTAAARTFVDAYYSSDTAGFVGSVSPYYYSGYRFSSEEDMTSQYKSFFEEWDAEHGTGSVTDFTVSSLSTYTSGDNYASMLSEYNGYVNGTPKAFGYISVKVTYSDLTGSHSDDWDLLMVYENGSWRVMDFS